MDTVMADRISSLVTDVRRGLGGYADPAYVPGTETARKPSKPILGVRIPLLRGTVKAALKAACAGTVNSTLVFGAADTLWHGEKHEEELAAAMMVRLAELTMPAATIRRWAKLLDNWLSVDELSGVVGTSLTTDPPLLGQLRGLADSPSPWQQRLYVVSLIRPIQLGLSPADVPGLVALLESNEQPVRNASLWLIREALKKRPEAAGQFRDLLPGPQPKPLIRILDRALV
ncbi:DNA alkylation repair protein [Nocardia sp. NPDC049220]|uniref:DNA alkylation repair protein n=1 Tax=Nocardia sp. NPDC049220 TaxID=3155273 RepID=UPI0033C9F37C